MEITNELEIFLHYAKKEKARIPEPAKFNIIEISDEETEELTAVELVSANKTFYCTNLITLADNLGLGCYISSAYRDGEVMVRVY